MSINRMNGAADAWDAALERMEPQAACGDDDGMAEFRRRFPQHSHLTADQIGERMFVDDGLRGDLHQFVDDMDALRERLAGEVDTAIAEAERELNRVRAIRDKARGPKQSDKGLLG